MFYEERARVIGERIKKNRKPLKLTQTELLAKVYLSEKSVASLRKWERGERLPDLDTLARMAELFDCDMGYLLGDYEESNFSSHKVCEYTGLSEQALENISSLKKVSQICKPFRIGDVFCLSEFEEQTPIWIVNSLLEDSQIIKLIYLFFAIEDIGKKTDMFKRTRSNSVLIELAGYLTNKRNCLEETLHTQKGENGDGKHSRTPQ